MRRNFFHDELTVEPPRHTLLLQGSRDGTYTGQIWPLVEIKGIQSLSVRDSGRATVMEVVSDEAAIWQRDWKKTADWHLRWARPPEPAAPTGPKPPRAPASTAANATDSNEDVFGYAFPFEPTKHSLLLQESRDGYYVGVLWPLAEVKGIDSFSVRKHGKTTTIRIVSDDAAIWQPKWKMTADWHRRWSKPKEPPLPKQGHVQSPKANAVPG